MPTPNKERCCCAYKNHTHAGCWCWFKLSLTQIWVIWIILLTNRQTEDNIYRSSTSEPRIPPSPGGSVHGLTKVISQLPSSVSAHHPLIIHVALVSDQQHLSVVPRVGLNLSRPGNRCWHELWSVLYLPVLVWCQIYYTFLKCAVKDYKTPLSWTEVTIKL